MSFIPFPYSTNTASEYLVAYVKIGNYFIYRERLVELSHFPELIDLLLALSIVVHRGVWGLLRIRPEALDIAYD